LLAIQGGAIHLSGCRLSVFLSLESDESKPFASVVHISHGTKLLKLGLETAVLEVLVDAVDK